MKFSLSFLKEFLDFKMSPRKIASILTMGGLEIEDIKKVKGDYIFEAEVTSNRSDWLSIFGIAHELAGLCGKRIKFKIPKVTYTPLLKEISIDIEDFRDCPLYIARLIKNVKILPSIRNVKEKVINCGINSVNSVVDITNYCMLKWGNPLHAFDFDKIEGNIHIRRAKDKETFVGLDNKEYLLSRENLVISDDKKVIALAGVIGAKNTEVDFNTKNILLEGAIFSPLTIRRSRRSVGLDTDSSYRFERGVLSKLLEIASYDAADFIIRTCGGINSGYKKVGKKVSLSKKRIYFNLSQLNTYIGKIFSFNNVKTILSNLGFTVKVKSKENFFVFPPFFRTDISIKEDIFEEIARCYGYNFIKEELPLLRYSHKRDSLCIFKEELKEFLLRLGLSEIITYSLTSIEKLDALKEKNFIILDNPLRHEENALRTTLLLGMVEAMRYNINQKNSNLRFFEIADVYKRYNKKILEEPFLGCIVNEESGGFYYLKGIVEKIIKFLNIKKAKFLEDKKENFLSGIKIIADNKNLGFLGVLNPKTTIFNLKSKLSFFEMDIKLAAFLKRDITYSAFSRYPVVFRDISLVLKKDVKFKEIEKTISDILTATFYRYRILDIYRGKDTPKGFVFLTLRIFYQAKDKTLTAEEVDKLHFKLRDELSKKEGITLR